MPNLGEALHGLGAKVTKTIVIHRAALALHTWLIEETDQYGNPLTPDWFITQLRAGKGQEIAMAIAEKIPEHLRRKEREKAAAVVQGWGPREYWAIVRAPVMNKPDKDGYDTSAFAIALDNREDFKAFCACMEVFKAWFLA